jgi:predicted nuclease with TOPRIM domain
MSEPNDLLARNALLLKELKAQRDANAVLTGKWKAAEREIFRLSTRAAALKEKLKTLRIANVAFEDKRRETERENAARLRREAKESVLPQELRAKIDELQKRIAALLSDKARLLGRITELEQAAEARKKRLEALRQENGRLADQLHRRGIEEEALRDEARSADEAGGGDKQQ